MSWKLKARGGILGLIGFLLSPLSWWNDAFINLPLAMAFAWLVGLTYKPAFEPAVIAGYWLTNIAGLMLMHKGVAMAVQTEEKPTYSLRSFVKDLAVSIGYTLVIIILIKLKLLRPFTDYFGQKP